jgi:hypothetical protein
LPSYLRGLNSLGGVNAETVAGVHPRKNGQAEVPIVMTDEGKKKDDVNNDTKLIGPKGGVSDKGIEDDRLIQGAVLKQVVAGNNKILREVHLPERTGKYIPKEK